MIINDEDLCAFADSDTPVDKDGYLYKWNRDGENFLRWYFVLKGNLLFYYQKRRGSKPFGVIVLEGCKTEPCEISDEYFCFKIVLHDININNFIIGVESKESRKQWMDALNCARWTYMKSQVEKLKRELNEIKGPEESSVPHQDSQSLRSSNYPLRPDENRLSATAGPSRRNSRFDHDREGGTRNAGVDRYNKQSQTKRKCSNCRREGHCKTKCPTKGFKLGAVYLA